MKKSLQILLLLILVALTAFAQEEPIPPRRTKAVKVGFFGGFTPAWISVDVNPINDFLRAGKGAPFNNNGVFLYGGAGAAYIMVVPNLRIGGVGMSGSISSTSVDASNIRRDAELSVGFGGVTIEYVFPVVERLDIAVGTMLGRGGIDLTLRQNNGRNDTWQIERDIFGGNAFPDNATRKLSGKYYVLVPSVNVEYALLGWLGARIGVSYVSMISPSWKVDDNYDLIGVPSNWSGKGFMVNAGIFIGTF